MSIKEKIPQPIKRMLKDVIRMKAKDVYNDEAINVRRELKRRKEVRVTSNIEDSKSLPIISYEWEQRIEKKLLKEPKSFSNIAIILDPYKKTPLCALALFITKKPCKAKFIVYGDCREDDVCGEVSECNTIHRLPIFGLYPDRENTVKIQLFGENDLLLEEKEVKIKTHPLAKSLADAVRVKKHGTTSAYGLIFISGKKIPYPYAFDSHGVIRYYMSFKPKGYGLIPLSRGRYIFFERDILYPTYQLPYSTQIYELDYLGRIHKIYYVPKGCHHDICEKEPGGNLLTITNSLKGHMGDVIIEIDRYTGTIVKQLDFRYIFYNNYRDNVNWIHLNTVSYNKEEDTLFICARNLHSVCKIKWKTNQLLWIFCDPRFWKETAFESKVLKPIGNVQWCYQPHAPYRISKDQFAIFDNHWHARRKISFFDGDSASYVKIFRVDEKKFTVSMEHSYQSVKAKITSNPRIEAEKKRVFSMGAYLEPLVDNRGGMIYEYDYDTEKVLNQYSIRHEYYRGYEFAPEYNELAKKMKLDENYIAGFLMKPKQVREKIPIPKKLLSHVDFEEKEEVIMKRMNEVIYIKTKDHLLRKVYFIGKKYTYLKDLSKPKQQDERFKDIVYAIAFPLHMLKPDRYKIIIDFKGTLYNTEKYVQID